MDCMKDEAWLVEYAQAKSKQCVWHARLGHPGKNCMDIIQRATSGMTVVEQSIEKLGGECQKGKMTNDNFLSHPITRISHVLELVDTNGLGTMKTVINVGARFMLTFVD